MTEPPDSAWAFVSGGKDSVATALRLRETGRLAGVVTFDTGIGVPEAVPFVRALAERLAVPFTVYRTPVVYEDLVRRYRFPCPATHYLYVSALKGRCVRQFRRDHPGAWGASGVRRSESGRRALNATQIGEWEGVRMWAPIFGWTTERVWEYLAENRERPSEASRVLGISGDCLCGAFSRREEAFLLKTAYPAVARRIADLEREVGETWGRWSEGLSTDQRRIDDPGETWGCSGACGSGRTAP